MRVALLVGVLMFDMFTRLYERGRLDVVASPDEGGQVQAFDDMWPPPPPSPSYP